jgi:hypothetical protein
MSKRGKPVRYNAITKVATDIATGVPVEYASIIIGGGLRDWAVECADGLIRPIRFTENQKVRYLETRHAFEAARAEGKDTATP